MDWKRNGEKTTPETSKMHLKVKDWKMSLSFVFLWDACCEVGIQPQTTPKKGTAYGQLLTTSMFQPYFCILHPPGGQHSSSGAMLALCSGCMHEHLGILDSFDIDRVLPVSGRSVNVSCRWNAVWRSPLSWFLALTNPVQPVHKDSLCFTTSAFGAKPPMWTLT